MAAVDATSARREALAAAAGAGVDIVAVSSPDELDVLRALRDETLTVADRDAAVETTLRRSVGVKKAGHAIGDPLFLQPVRGMNAIGG